MNTMELINKIHGLNTEAMDIIQKRLNNLTKPLGSLGTLEDIVKRLGGITGDEFPSVKNKTVIIMCADNGVTDEKVSSCPKSVTATVTENFTKGFTGINVFTRHVGADIKVIDIGVDADIDIDGVINKKIRKGTSNMAKGPAMTREEALKGLTIGIETVKELKDKGVNLLGTGEMGIGNTTTSSAIASVLTGSDVEKMVGIGSGLTKEAFKNKIEIVKRSIEINKPDKDDPIDVLRKVGGFDIAGLAGCFLGAAIYRLPIVIDGFISAAAALLAVKINPMVREFLIPSHGSAEPGSTWIMEELKLEPMLNLKMRLGEGTGAALAFQLIDMAVFSYVEMGTFQKAEIEPYKPLK
ncbi:nicotinate-nucleotide--dimethylbenzimidazole phosphoribosyltransferase [Clostridium felsineum]|uniref:Nicotinate-nucleotide--dimethylbenzimidazole phosphoribosyltransferase n=1 Tax=Clostridium felsineum TaxID=36839 RepID=A0A1S8LQD0_9CLOT|nr:nicotinate-nucleotide--dimethylbenzimidazole phosphoribosyltransferase [Clostridium felsineum]URZ06187.1 Nicotinate-nucleotide--dimethylbenzimidazole phosphoribosyltransferase [Clostridium felsineum]URZ11222.1 Nicotinate-nucleotide--dimethylbenzimidazole phosphoribosyltransferase [Clostridium felsineum]